MADSKELTRAHRSEVMEQALHGLLKWQRDFVMWYISGRHSRQDTLAKLKELSGTTWTWPQLVEMRRQPLFSDYYNIMREEGLAAARVRIGELAYKAVAGLDEGIDDTRKAKDWNTMSKLTGQVLERAMPRRDDLQQQRMTININLTEKQRALLDSEPIEVEAHQLDG